MIQTPKHWQQTDGGGVGEEEDWPDNLPGGKDMKQQTDYLQVEKQLPVWCKPTRYQVPAEWTFPVAWRRDAGKKELNGNLYVSHFFNKHISRYLKCQDG